MTDPNPDRAWTLEEATSVMIDKAVEASPRCLIGVARIAEASR
ncbi:hypothetical protein [Lichenifustis flavocetrariae]|nr:hypothetical protein [Lichenifustis flavocetrariae]